MRGRNSWPWRLYDLVVRNLENLLILNSHKIWQKLSIKLRSFIYIVIAYSGNGMSFFSKNLIFYCTGPLRGQLCLENVQSHFRRHGPFNDMALKVRVVVLFWPQFGPRRIFKVSKEGADYCRLAAVFK